VICIVPSGRFTVPSDPTLLVGAAPLGAIRGCHVCTQAALVQIHFPFCSPERWYSVMPCALTRIVAPSVELDAVFTTGADVPLLVCDEVGALEADGLLDVLLELLPHAASNSDTASVGNMAFTI
jgi:hypothetical protein